MLTAAVLLAALALAVALAVLAWALVRAADRADPVDPVDQAYQSLPAGRPELLVDTDTGGHDRYPHMADNIRDIVLAYCEDMWQHTTEDKR